MRFLQLFYATKGLQMIPHLLVQSHSKYHIVLKSHQTSDIKSFFIKDKELRGKQERKLIYVPESISVFVHTHC